MRPISPPPRWSAHDVGTSEQQWVHTTPWSKLSRIDMDAVCATWERVVVISAHPDDETLAAGGFIAELAARNMPVQVVALTDGECSHGKSETLTPEVIRQVRVAELDAALNALGVSAPISVHLPDGSLATKKAELELLFTQLFTGDRVLVLAPHPRDGHSDHDAAGEVAAQVAQRVGAACIHYPVWLWHWCTPELLDWAHAAVLSPNLAALARKSAALTCYPSQTGMFGRHDDEPVLPERILRHFERVVEVLFDPDDVLPQPGAEAGRTPAASFDDMFDGSDDPWGVETRWYERRKRALVMAMLPEEKLGRTLDVGCSTGALTELLAQRASSVIALDGSEQALKRARQRQADVEWRLTTVPEGLTDLEGPFETIVISEIGYFLDGVTLLELFSAADSLLAENGIVVVVNWQHPTKNIPLDGVHVDRAARSAWSLVAHYRDDDVAITIGRKTQVTP